MPFSLLRDIVEVVLPKDAEVLARFHKYCPMATELFYAVSDGTVADVAARLQAGDDPNSRSVDNRTALYHALQFEQNLPKADLLVESGAEINVWDDFGMHPLLWAANSGDRNQRSLRWLLDRGVDPNLAVRAPARDPFRFAVGWTALHIAAYEDALAAIELLIGRGADVKCKAIDGSTPLHVASRRFRLYKRLCRALLNAGADPNTQTFDGTTPLHDIAAGYGKYRKTITRLLLSRGASLDLHDHAGRLPIDVLTWNHPDTEAMKKLLSRP